MLRIILNLQESESSSLELTLCVTRFSMKLHCRNTSKHTHTHTRAFTFTSSWGVKLEAKEAELVEKRVRCVVWWRSICESSVVRPALLWCLEAVEDRKHSWRWQRWRCWGALGRYEDGWDQEWVLQRDSMSRMMWMWSQTESLDMCRGGTVKRDPEEDPRLDTWTVREVGWCERRGWGRQRRPICWGEQLKVHLHRKPLGRSQLQNKWVQQTLEMVSTWTRALPSVSGSPNLLTKLGDLRRNLQS